MAMPSWLLELQHIRLQQTELEQTAVASVTLGYSRQQDPIVTERPLKTQPATWMK